MLIAVKCRNYLRQKLLADAYFLVSFSIHGQLTTNVGSAGDTLTYEEVAVLDIWEIHDGTRGYQLLFCIGPYGSVESTILHVVVVVDAI